MVVLPALYRVPAILKEGASKVKVAIRDQRVSLFRIGAARMRQSRFGPGASREQSRSPTATSRLPSSNVIRPYLSLGASLTKWDFSNSRSCCSTSCRTPGSALTRWSARTATRATLCHISHKLRPAGGPELKRDAHLPTLHSCEPPSGLQCEDVSGSVYLLLYQCCGWRATPMVCHTFPTP